MPLVVFGMGSVILSVWWKVLEEDWQAASSIEIAAIWPLTVLSNLIAQTVPFNAIFLVSDTNQIWRLIANMALFLMPFLAGAFFLGIVFLKSGRTFGRAYFAELVGSGIASTLVPGARSVWAPETLLSLTVPCGGAGCGRRHRGDGGCARDRRADGRRGRGPCAPSIAPVRQREGCRSWA